MLTGFIREEPLQELYVHWRARSADGRRVPGRDDMDMLDLPRSVLPHAFIYEREDDGRFRCRLAGTAFVEELGYEPTGRHLDEMLDPVLGERRLKIFEECVARPGPLYYRARLTPIGHEHRESGRLLLPVVGDGDGQVPRFVFGAMMVLRLAVANPERADPDGMIEVHRDPPVNKNAQRRCG